MTRKNLLLSALAAISAAMLITACGNTSTPNATVGAISPSGAKIGYVNSDSLFENFNMIKDLEEELIAEKLQMQNQFQVEYQKLEKDYMDAQQGASQLSQEALGILQRRLAQREQELGQMQQQMEGQLMQSEGKKNEEYLKVIREYLDNYGAENGYQIIYSYNGVGNVLYIDSAYDITSLVLDGLNKTYESTQETTEVE